MNTDKKLTISVGIPAYNEEANIGHLLRAILRQDAGDYELLEIIVVSDGSTDRTAEIVRSLNIRHLHLLEGNERQGKIARLNQIFDMARGDIIITFDADIVLNDEFVIEQLVLPFLENSRLGLVAGNAMPLEPETLIERGVANFLKALSDYCKPRHGGRNPYAFWGCVMAMSRSMMLNMRIPIIRVPEDSFRYLYARSHGFDVHYQKSAKVFFRCPQTIPDQIRQGIRFRVNRINLMEVFGKKFVTKEYLVPFGIRLRMFFSQLTASTAAYILFKSLAMGSKFLSIDRAFTANTWKRASSTKNLYKI